jgi:hypothetical protein
MNWPSVLENLGVFGIASGLLTWLIKSLLKQSLARELEKFKGDLQQAHAVEMEEAKNRFTVGATSHMANLAFDKHVEFCESYTSGVNGALATLFRRGPSERVLEDANTLSSIRTKWTLWLTPDVENGLIKFESALRKIGANAWLLGELREGEDRGEAIKEAFKTFADVMGWKSWKGEELTGEVAAERVLEELRKTLGIEELTHLRTELVNRALANLKDA